MKMHWIARGMVCVVMMSLGAGDAPPSSQPASARKNVTELIVSEYSAVSYIVARGAPLKVTVKGKEQTYYELTNRVGDQGEYNMRANTRVPNLAMILCGYLYPEGKAVVDVLPDAPEPGEALECKIVVKADLAGERLLDEYTYEWKRFEGTQAEYASGKGKWTAADVPKKASLDKGITREGERWACFVVPVRPDGKKAGSLVAIDRVEIGKGTPGDSRLNWNSGAYYGQYRHTRGYFKFELAEAQKKIKAAKFRVFCDMQGRAPYKVNAYACAETWNEREITWVNQPLKFPFEQKPVGSSLFEFGPLPTAENPASKADWCFSSSPDFKAEKSNRAPAWREIDITEYAKARQASGAKSLSLCIALENPSLNGMYDHDRIQIHNEKIAPGYSINRGDMRPRLALEFE